MQTEEIVRILLCRNIAPTGNEISSVNESICLFSIPFICTNWFLALFLFVFFFCFARPVLNTSQGGGGWVGERHSLLSPLQTLNYARYSQRKLVFLEISKLFLTKLFGCVNVCELGSGAKLDKSKTEAIWLGAWMLRLDEALSLKWVSKMKVLGVVFDIVSFEKNNWQQKINQHLCFVSFERDY